LASSTTPSPSAETPEPAAGSPAVAPLDEAAAPDGARPDAAGPDLPDPLDDEPPARRLLTFRVGGRTMGCPLDVAREVLPAGAVTRLPGAPAHVIGLQNVRGRVVTVLDVARRLDPAAPASTGAHVIVVESADGRTAGCRVDAVLRAVPAPELAPPAPAGGPGNAGGGGIVLGVGQVDGAPVTVLDLPRFVGETLVDPGER